MEESATGWEPRLGPSGELRRAARKAFAAQVRLTLPGHEPVTYLSHDLSPGGVFLRALRPLPKGTLVGLAFQLPAMGRFSCLAQVAWTTRDRPSRDGRSGMGLRFAPLDPDELAPVLRFLDADPDRRRVLILEDGPRLREALAASFLAQGLSVAAAGWADAEDALSQPHALLVLGVDRAGLVRGIVDRRPRPRRVALLGYGGGSAEWQPHALFCFNKPVDPEQVARISLALFR
jgi:hypothetical protein